MPDSYLLQEIGDILLLETGDKMVLDELVSGGRILITSTRSVIGSRSVIDFTRSVVTSRASI